MRIGDFFLNYTYSNGYSLILKFGKSKKIMKKDVLGGIVVLLLCVVAYFGLRAIVSRQDTENKTSLTQDERAAIEEFEVARLNDSARQQAHWDSLHGVWDAEKAARQQARDAREAAYADSQRVWAARREQWASDKAERQSAAAARQAHYDSLRASRPQKLPVGSVVDLNSADTTLLKQIPGIGSYYARKIITYREQLGGFVSARQVEEIDGLPHSIASWFRVSPSQSIHRININRADFKTLVHHPYLSYEQTKAIMNCRKQTMRLRSWDDLRNCPEFSEADISRLTPYIAF